MKDKDKAIKAMMQRGSLGVLALGYRGIKMWREQRPAIPNKPKEENEKEK